VKLVRKREVLRNTVEIGGIHNSSFAEAAKAMGVFGLGQVAATGAEAEGLASGGDFKSFGHGLFRFDAFGTSHKLIQKSANYTCPLQSSKGKKEIIWLFYCYDPGVIE
jgi:hypothetical protein